VISVIEAAFGALLVALARDSLPIGSHDGRAWLGAIASAPAAAAAQHQARAATLAISLQADRNHPRPTPKSWLPREPGR
jgi:hypothetical protein